MPGDASESVGLWRETWAETYGPCLGTSRLDGLLPGLAAGTASMLPGWGERGDRLSAGARIIGLSKRLEIRALRTSPGGQAFYRAWGFEPVGDGETELMAGGSPTRCVLVADIAALRASPRLAAAWPSVTCSVRQLPDVQA